jgi:hypothetical protein
VGRRASRGVRQRPAYSARASSRNGSASRSRGTANSAFDTVSTSSRTRSRCPSRRRFCRLLVGMDSVLGIALRRGRRRSLNRHPRARAAPTVDSAPTARHEVQGTET